MEDSNWGSMYRQIGVEPVINAIGNVSVLGGSTAAPAVRSAMEAANEHPEPLPLTAELWSYTVELQADGSTD